jgi:hypothetical protein
MSLGHTLLPRYNIVQVKEGYRNVDHEKGDVSMGSSVTLVTGLHNVLVGTGLPSDKHMILSALDRQSVKAGDVSYVVCSDGRVENIGNLNLFPDAVHVVESNIMKRDNQIMHQFREGVPYEIDDDLEIILSPGISHSSVALMVSRSNLGTVAVASGAFHSAADLEDPDLWMEYSHDPEAQQRSRIQILREANYIVPRYGALFEVPACYKGEMQIVMTPTP